ncbi:MAG: acyl-CoA dehydrogenase family protein [Anaerolineae bacterium]|jgi:alkylation response protein AidB-like acyl-CoA dehydrogenase|nr:acyl-CoA dehydrogenase family protein [Anaerolineae bacterium]
MIRDLYEPEHLAFGSAFQAFLDQEVAPYHAEWEQNGIVDRELWRKAGERGFLAMYAEPEYGGQGLDDFRYNAILVETQARSFLSGPMLSLGSDVVIPYIWHYGSPEQKARWLPKLIRGEYISAIGMSEPETGSDLASITTTAEDCGDHYRVNGTKFWISNGHLSNLIVLVVKTDPAKRHRGISLIVLERSEQPYETVQILDKMGYLARDVAELKFDNVRVPKENLLGQAGEGFRYMMQQLPQERLIIAVGNVATAEAVLAYTLDWVKERTAFGQPIGSFQNTRFKLAELQTEVRIARVFVDNCIKLHLEKKLTTEEASMAKWWCSELLMKVNTTCLQFFGGRGYLIANPVAKAYRDTRVEPIYGGTNEIMKEIIGKSLGL